MILYSTRARMSGQPTDALAWAKEVATLVGKAGGAVDTAVRIGAHQDIVWLSRHQSLADLDAWLMKWQADPAYMAMVKTAVEKGLFDPASVESGVWRAI